MLNRERMEGVKEYPAISESQALKDFTFNTWSGLFVKKDTPEPVVQALHKAISETLGDAQVRANLEANSRVPAKPQSLAAVSKVYTDGTAQYRAIAKSIDLKPQ